jgi:hypothetical protein
MSKDSFYIHDKWNVAESFPRVCRNHNPDTISDDTKTIQAHTGALFIRSDLHENNEVLVRYNRVFFFVL